MSNTEFKLPPLLFPDVTDINKLFDRIVPAAASKPDDATRPAAYYLVDGGELPHSAAQRKPGDVPFGPYCYRHTLEQGYLSYDVHPTLELATCLQRRMIWVAYDAIHFKIVDHKDNMSLVVASYSQILGTHWLSYVRTDSIPVRE